MITGNMFQKISCFLSFCRTLIYRCFDGRVYGTSKGEVQIETCSVGDVITFTYDRRQRHFYIQKVRDIFIQSHKPDLNGRYQL